MSTGLFFVRRESIWITLDISLARPITGSSAPSSASFVKSRPWASRVGVLPFCFFCRSPLSLGGRSARGSSGPSSITAKTSRILSRSMPRAMRMAAPTPSPSCRRPMRMCATSMAANPCLRASAKASSSTFFTRAEAPCTAPPSPRGTSVDNCSSTRSLVRPKFCRASARSPVRVITTPSRRCSVPTMACLSCRALSSAAASTCSAPGINGNIIVFPSLKPLRDAGGRSPRALYRAPRRLN
ncbi:MAG: hypothetical protein DDT35_00740 [Firmicutes bacterium]|nr:hypothetical protein [Bacillota bacterium]